MGIPIEKSFVVKAPADAVWAFLTDPRRVARCLPGAAVTEQLDAETYAGTINVKVGPVTAAYRGKMHFDRLDPAAREAELSGSGQETRGKGGADMRMKSRIVERSPGESEVTVVSDVNVIGVLAQFGRGMIQDVSDQLFQRFTDGMRRELEGPAGGGTGGAIGGSAAAEAEPTPMSEAAASVSAPGMTGMVWGVGAATEAAAAEGGAAGAATPSTPSTPNSPPPVPSSPASASAAVAAGRAQEPLAASPEGVLDVGAIGAAAMRRALGRTARRPLTWVVIVVAAVLIYWFFVR